MTDTKSIISTIIFGHMGRLMGREFFTLDDFDLSEKTVLLRVDINSPIDPSSGRLLNDARIREHMVTIRDLWRSKVAILAHQSRPGKDDFTTLEVHALRIGQLLGRPVRYVDSLFNSAAIEAIKSLRSGDVAVLENTRFYAEEEVLADDKTEKMSRTHMVRKLAPLADYFVLDAFAAAHRAQPSLMGFCEVLPSLAGRVMERELVMLSRAMKTSGDGKIAIFGGIKADDTVDAAQHMLEKRIVDKVLTAGGVANVFLVARGVRLGEATESFLEKELDDYHDVVARCRSLLERFGDRIVIPTDVAVNNDGRRSNVRVADLPSDKQVYDLGWDTIARYIDEVKAAKTIIINGPAGVFELEEFSIGTREIFNAVAESGAFTIAGGGHTVAAVEQFGLTEKIDHVSTGGGALINFLSGKPLPLVEALKRSYIKHASKS